ncbi:MAG: hypothetical protein GX131_01600 [candidate division WS1 bacterium]|nr:hypothetical protein [candidate division WS1 bacterium]
MIIALCLIAAALALPCSAQENVAEITPGPQAARQVCLTDFADAAVDGDWAPALQAAIDSFASDDPALTGGTLLIPPGVYPVSRPVTLGTSRGQWGLHVVGYGATLRGTETLDAFEMPEREPEEAELGIPILQIHGMEGIEGGNFCIEGLTFDREARGNGVGISLPMGHGVAKNTTFRSIKVTGQNVGVHINYQWQIFFAECMFRGNGRGMIIQNHGNNIGLTNCTFRRNNYDGLVIGPDRGQWGSNGQHISGTIFEANKGYGLLLLTSAQTFVAGCYFEANGNHLGVMTEWETTIDTNLFWGYYGHGWRRNEFSDNACIVVRGANRLQMRNNKYAAVNAWFRRAEDGERWEYVPVPPGPQGVKDKAPVEPVQEEGFVYEQRPVGIMIQGNLSGDFVFDALPVLHPEATVETTAIARDTGLSYYGYDEATHSFIERSLLPE